MSQSLDVEMSRYLNQVAQLPCCRHVILFTSDGLIQAKSDDISRDVADTVAAALSGMRSISEVLAEFCGTTELRWNRTIVDLDGNTVELFAAGANSYLAVSISAPLDDNAVAMVSYSAAKAANAMRHHLGSAKREQNAPAPHPESLESPVE
ncbi:roadblock/LC7 domain-containing protein [Streptomyces solisilvae]|uniref:roadblock/LC7 domain-containing protein n=1 Tax=Streptomyces malaysiensis TaxID=92644 RepID=UPI0036C164F6